VSGSVQVGSSDADGFRFFGNRITLRGNYIHDIDAKASPGDAHTDCFQTFTESKQPITDVLVEGNTCDRVTDQCLIAEGEATSSRRLRFVNNICRNSGSQALQLTNVHDVLVANNLFLQTIRFTGVFVAGGSDGVTIVNNAFVGKIDPVNRDGSTAAPNFHHNLAGYLNTSGAIVQQCGTKALRISAPDGWSGKPGVAIAVPCYVSSLPANVFTARPGILKTDPTVDRGVAVAGVTRDFSGRARPTDGNGDGVAAFDIGAYESLTAPRSSASSATTNTTAAATTTTKATTTTAATTSTTKATTTTEASTTTAAVTTPTEAPATTSGD
jgi:hypothetical protein